jgi:hypothetical protein
MKKFLIRKQINKFLITQQIKKYLLYAALAGIFIFIPAKASGSQNYDFKINNNHYFWSDSDYISLKNGDVLTLLSAKSPAAATEIDVTLSSDGGGNASVVGKNGVTYNNIYFNVSAERNNATLNLTDVNVANNDIGVLYASARGESASVTIKLNGSNNFNSSYGADSDSWLGDTCVMANAILKFTGPGSLNIKASGERFPCGIVCLEGGVDIGGGVSITIAGANGILNFNPIKDLTIGGGANFTTLGAESLGAYAGLSSDLNVVVSADAGLVYTRSSASAILATENSFIQTGNIENFGYPDVFATKGEPWTPLERIKVEGNPPFQAGDVVETRVPAANGHSEYVYRSPIVNGAPDSVAYLWLPEGEYEFTANGYASARARLTQNENALILSGSARTAAPTTAQTPAPTLPSSGGSAVSFNDVNESDWFYTAVTYATERGLFAGNSNGEFKPNAEMTRAVLTVLLGRLHGADVGGYKAGSFSDVAADKSYMPYVEWAKANGIIYGVSETVFEPDRAVKREEIAAILLRYAEFAKKNTQVARKYPQFNDYDKISYYAKYAAEVLQNADVLTGRPGNVFDPSATVTRAETAQLLMTFEKNFDLS